MLLTVHRTGVALPTMWLDLGTPAAGAPIGMIAAPPADAAPLVDPSKTSHSEDSL